MQYRYSKMDHKIALLFLIQLGLICLSEGWYHNKFNNRECYDVAIVGGGIGGTYTAWKLRNQGLDVAIFENTDRIGGRTFTVSLPSVPNVALELGAMRYLPGVHTTLENLAKELRLPIKIFQPDQFKKLYNLRGRQLLSRDLLTNKLPYNLAPGESKNTGELKWSISQRALNVSRPDQIRDIQDFSTSDGIPVYKQGYLSMVRNFLSNEALHYLQDTDPFRVFYEPNLNAAHEIAAGNPNNPPITRWTVGGGMNAVAKKLASDFLAASRRHLIKLNRRVDSIHKNRQYRRPVYDLTVYITETIDGYTRDTLARPKTVCAEKVILAVPHRALQNIHWYPLQYNPEVQKSFESLKEFRAMKIYLSYPGAWWDNLGINSARAFVTDNPIRQGYEFGRFRNASGHENAVMLVAYVDGEDTIDYWMRLRNHPTAFPSSVVQPAFSVSTRILEHVHGYLASVYGIKSRDMPMPIDGIMHIWSNPVNGGSWDRFNPGFQPKSVAKFMRRPEQYENVFIVTNSYSKDNSVWTEGSLRAANDVLREFFNIF